MEASLSSTQVYGISKIKLRFRPLPHTPLKSRMHGWTFRFCMFASRFNIPTTQTKSGNENDERYCSLRGIIHYHYEHSANNILGCLRSCTLLWPFHLSPQSATSGTTAHGRRSAVSA